jgi:hypothetical protein
MTNLFTPPRIQFSPLDKLYFSATGTSTPQAVYTDIDLTTPHQDPIVCDAEGYCDPIYLDPSLPNYRFRRTNSAGVQQELHDDIPANQTESRFFRLKHTAPYLILEEIDQTAGNKKWFIRANGNQLDIGPLDDAESTFTAALSISRAGVVSIDGDTVSTTVSGTFTGTMTGLTTSPTATIRYTIHGGVATVTVPALFSGTSNSTACTITGMPDTLKPATAKFAAIPACVFNDNSVISSTVAVRMDPSVNAISMTKDGLLTGFTNSGSKGAGGAFSFTYELT